MSGNARDAIANDEAEVLVSAVSALEVTTKFRLGKLARAERLAREFELALAEQGFVQLPLSVAQARMAGSLPMEHKDPFDRLLIAQALTDDLVLVSNETAFDRFGVRRLW